MIEMLGVLAIIGVLSVGGIVGYSKAMNKCKINKLVDQIITISANIRTTYMQQSTYSGLNNQMAVIIGAIPDEFSTTSDLKNPYRGDYIIKTVDYEVDYDNRAFAISANGISKEACIALLSNDWGKSGSGLHGIVVNGAYVSEAYIKDAVLTGI